MRLLPGEAPVALVFTVYLAYQTRPFKAQYLSDFDAEYLSDFALFRRSDLSGRKKENWAAVFRPPIRRDLYRRRSRSPRPSICLQDPYSLRVVWEKNRLGTPL